MKKEPYEIVLKSTSMLHSNCSRCKSAQTTHTSSNCAVVATQHTPHMSVDCGVSTYFGSAPQGAGKVCTMLWRDFTVMDSREQVTKPSSVSLCVYICIYTYIYIYTQPTTTIPTVSSKSEVQASEFFAVSAVLKPLRCKHWRAKPLKC